MMCIMECGNNKDEQHVVSCPQRIKQNVSALKEAQEITLDEERGSGKGSVTEETFELILRC